MFLFNGFFVKMDSNPGAGGGGGNPNPAPNPNPNPAPNPGSGGSVTFTKEQFDALMSRLPNPSPAPNPNPAPAPKDDPSLEEKARLQREELERKTSDSKRLEKAVRFTLAAKEWAKTNASLLPKTIDGILDQAEKENYATAVEKDNAIKVGLISEFFGQQANLDLLTDSQKVVLEDFKKLTKDKKQEQVQQLYETLFEPTFESLKKIKKAQEVGAGQANSTDAESAYKKKLMELSQKHYLGEKK
jgi:hypothetical protein